MVLSAGWIMRLLRGEHVVLNFDKGGSAPAAPPAPDPRIQIEAEAKANRYNVRSPFGTQTWIPPAPIASAPIASAVPPAPVSELTWQQRKAGETAPPAAPSLSSPPAGQASSDSDAPWTQVIELDPSQQRQFDVRNQIAESMLGRAGTQLNQFDTNQFQFDPAGSGARTALNKMGQTSPSFTQQAGAFNPDTGSGRAAFNPNVDDATSRELVSRLKGMSDTPWSSGVDGSKVSNAVYAKAKALLDPTYGRMQQDLDQKLVNQGLPIGSEAYGQANDVFGRERSNAYNTAAQDAIIQGAQEEQNQFGRALSTRQQGVNEIAGALSGAQTQSGAEYGRQANTRQIQSGDISDIFQRELAKRGQQSGEFGDDFARRQGQQEAVFSGERALTADDQSRALTQRQQQYNELAALLGGQQLNPLNASGGGLDTSSAFANQQAGRNQQYQGQLADYNAGVASNNSNTAAMAAIAAAMISDVRLKRDIERKGTLMPGVGIYEFQYVWGGDRQLGVMAQEVERVMPEAVIERADGFLMVDYGLLLAGRTLH